jgi:hypothetical protein
LKINLQRWCRMTTMVYQSNRYHYKVDQDP